MMQKIFAKKSILKIVLFLFYSFSGFCETEKISDLNTSVQNTPKIQLENSFELEKVNANLKDFSLNKDTVSYLTQLALVQKNHYRNNGNQFFLQSQSQFGVYPYFGNFGSVFLFFIIQNQWILLLVFGAIVLLLTLLYFLGGRKVGVYLYTSVLLLMFMLLINNWTKLQPLEKSIVHNQQFDLLDEPSFLSKNFKNKITKGELLTIKKSDSVWYEVRFEDSLYYVPKNQKPYIF
jgi:hypothetical protein